MTTYSAPCRNCEIRPRVAGRSLCPVCYNKKEKVRRSKDVNFIAKRNSYHERYKHNRPQTQWNSVKNSARQRGVGRLQITRLEFIEWFNSVPKVCDYCGIPEDASVMRHKQKLHTDRINNEIGYKIGNIALACRACNLSKNDLFTGQEWKEIAEKYIRPKWEAVCATSHGSESVSPGNSDGSTDARP